MSWNEFKVNEAEAELQRFMRLKDDIANLISQFEAATDWTADKGSLGAMYEYLGDAYYKDEKRANQMVNGESSVCHKDVNSFNDAREG